MPAPRLTLLVQERIAEALQKGHTMRDAAALAGVGRSTVYGWLDRGAKARTGAHRRFVDAVNMAQAEFVESCLTVIVDNMPAQPTLALSLLERRRPDDFGKRERHELAGSPGGEPLRIRLEWTDGPQAGQEGS